jgi:predicted DNA-binding protein (MmcQ/YjbR family)
MTQEQLRMHCLSFPYVKEEEKWKNDLCFTVGGKMFAVMSLEPTIPYPITFKVTPEEFALLTERDGIVPAPYLARYHWISLESLSLMTDSELSGYVKNSYQMVLNKLPKKIKHTLT